MPRINQKVVYEIDGKTFPDYVSAEAHAVDAFGEEIDALFKGIDTGAMRYTEHSKMLIQLVERMWERREEFAKLLTLEYSESGYIQERIDDAISEIDY